jgi:putative transposase
MDNTKAYYRRHLPHYQPENAGYHVVFRLAGSLPVSAIEELRREQKQFDRALQKNSNADAFKRLQADYRQKYFERFDELLDGSSTGPTWLKQPTVAAIVHEAILYRDGKEYDLYASTIMPNHVHMVFELQTVGRLAESTSEENGQDGVSTYKVTRVLESLKKYTALRANQVLKRNGQFWQRESYDHMIREGRELERTIWYVLNNSVKAGLVLSWEQWRWTYVKPGIL